MLGALHGLARHVRIDQVECLWEPYMLLAARIREAFGLPGMTVGADAAVPRQGADEAGARRRRHPHAAARRARPPWPGSGRPPSGSATRSSSSRSPAPARPTPTGSTPPRELAEVLPMLRHVPEVSVEEFVDGEEFTFDTVCAERQDPLRERAVVPPAAAADAAARVGQPGVDRRCATCRCPHLPGGRAMGAQVLAALGFRDRVHAHGVVPQARPARRCSARSPRGRRAPGSST